VLISYSLAVYGDRKKLFHSEEDIETYFPVLKVIFQSLDDNAPLISESKQLGKVANSNKMVAESAKGLSVNLNVSGYSIHENRPGQAYDQSYRTVGSIYVKKPVYHWGG